MAKGGEVTEDNGAAVIALRRNGFEISANAEQQVHGSIQPAAQGQPGVPARAAPVNDESALAAVAADLPSGDGARGGGGGGVPRLEDTYIGAWITQHYLEGKFLHHSGFRWMKFDGRRWKPVPETAVGEVIRKALIELHRCEAQVGVEPRRLQEISRMLSAAKIRAITFVAKLQLATEAVFDAHPDLINVANGVVDLRTGALGPHDPELMLTKLAPVNYVPGAWHADWHEAALGAVPDDAVQWLQVRFGQAITGFPVSDDRLVVFRGSGANGKTTVIDGIREALGPDYAVTMPDRVLLAHQGDHPTELMTLRGARVALMEEFPELGHLNVKRLKDLLGTGEMSARYCGKDTMVWKPTHTPFVTTNYLPRVDESDDGTWRRLVLLEFPYRYRRPGTPLMTQNDKEGDPRLRERLRQGSEGQHEAILAWLIEGAVQWYQSGRRMPNDPPSVVQATGVWRKNSDVLMRYSDERLAFDPQSQVVATELFEDFNAWLLANGHRPWSDQSFSARFAQHGEAIANEVSKKRSRRSPAVRLSRRPRARFGDTGATPGSAVPKQFTAWVGIRFQTPEDMDSDDDQV
jgi:P4 family phage/plasmid primase-like protien